MDIAPAGHPAHQGQSIGTEWTQTRPRTLEWLTSKSGNKRFGAGAQCRDTARRRRRVKADGFFRRPGDNAPIAPWDKIRPMRVERMLQKWFCTGPECQYLSAQWLHWNIHAEPLS